MKKYVTEDQIQKLYGFTKSHFVEHYDLQTELVDHLANSIEHQWETTPELPFEDCLNSEFKKFGIFGFLDIVKKRKKTLKQKYRKLIIKKILTFFKLPKIILTLGATALLYIIVRDSILPPKTLFAIWFISIFFIILRFSTMNREYKKRIKAGGKRWVLEEMIFNTAIFPQTLGLAIYLPLEAYLQKWEINNQYGLMLICFDLILFIILNYIALFYLPQNAEKYLQETYPEYKIA